MSKYLTEQWKKGELEAGWYYVLLFSNEEYITFIDGNWVVDDRLVGSDIKQILAPVPSYKEWQAKDEENKNLYKMLDVLNRQLDSLLKEDKENQQLKELLKDCYKMLAQYHVENSEPSLDENIQLLTKIDNAIGEKK